MSNTKKNHYIPQSYLKPFSKQVNKQHYIGCSIDKKDVFPNNIINVCSENYLYDLSALSAKNRSFIENFYANEVDCYFPEILEFANNTQANQLSQELRIKIIKSVLSLYFRTPKFLKDFTILDTQLTNHSHEIKQKIKETHRLQLLAQHLSQYRKLIELKMNDGISINFSIEDIEYITGDNPVIMRNIKGDLTNSFSSENMIHVPLSPKTSITIMPSKFEDNKNTFTRYNHDKFNVLTINSDIQKYHEKFLLGTNDGLITFLSDIKEYNDPSTKKGVEAIEYSNNIRCIEEINHFILDGDLESNEFNIAFTRVWNNNPKIHDLPHFLEIAKQIGLI